MRFKKKKKKPAEEEENIPRRLWGQFADQRRLKTSVKQEQRDMKGGKGNLKSQVSSSSTLSQTRVFHYRESSFDRFNNKTLWFVDTVTEAHLWGKCPVKAELWLVTEREPMLPACQSAGLTKDPHLNTRRRRIFLGHPVKKLVGVPAVVTQSMF